MGGKKMKKMFRKAVVAAMTAVMALSSVIASPVTAKADDAVELTLLNDGQVRAEGDVYRVNIFNSWTGDANDVLTNADSFNGATKIEVTFTVSGLGDKTGKAGINMSNSDWGDVQYWFDDSVAAVKASNAEVTADGTYTATLETTGDYKFDTVAFIDLQTDIASSEGEKDLEITSGIDIAIDKIVVYGGTDSAVEGAVKEEATQGTVTEAFDPNGEYNAYFGFQTPSWSFRNSWCDKDYGVASDVFNQVTGWDADNNAVVRPGTITDVKIAGNGTYTVGVSGIGEWIADELKSTEGIFNLLFLSTDMPVDEAIKITDVKLIVDGKSCHTDKEGFLNPDYTDHIEVLVQNIWNENKAEISYYPVPTDSIEIQFTVSGFAYDNESQAADDSAAPTTTAADEKEDGNNNVIIIVIVVVVIAVVVVALVLSKKSKGTKE